MCIRDSVGPTDELAARAKEFEKAIELLTNSMSKEDTNALLVDVLDSLKTLINGKPLNVTLMGGK